MEEVYQFRHAPTSDRLEDQASTQKYERFGSVRARIEDLYANGASANGLSNTSLDAVEQKLQARKLLRRQRLATS